jgi:dCTP deaminase
VLLSDTDIKKALEVGDISIEKMTIDSMQPASVDLHLSRWVRKFPSEGMVDPADDSDNSELIEVLGSYMMNPGEFMLASCTERIEIGNGYAGRIEGKSSLGRLGLLVHITAGFFDPGFKGYPTLELINSRNGPFMLYPGMKIAQMSFFRTMSPSSIPYGHGTSKYQNQGEEPAASKYYLNFQ